MVLTVTEDTPADMLAGSMELLVQLPRDHHVHTQRVTVPRSTPMMDLLVQIATAHKLAASSYTLQAIGERGLVLPHQPNTPIGALDALQVKLLPKQGTFLPRKAKQANQPFETTFRLQVLLPRNQLYVSRVSPKMNLGKILDEVCREKNLDKNKYELRHPANIEETLDLSLSLQDYHLQEVTLYAKQGKNLGAALSSQDIMALQRQEERRRQQAKQSVFGFMFKKSKESSLSIDSLGERSVSPARSDETGRSVSPLAPPARPLRKRRPAPKPPVRTTVSVNETENGDESKEKLVISHSRNSSDSSGYHEASVLSDNTESNGRMPETLPRCSKLPCKMETSRKLAQTSQASKSLGNLAMATGGLSHGISSTSISSTDSKSSETITVENSSIRKKRVAPPPPIARPLSSALSTQALERIVDSEESLTSDIDISKSPSDIAASSKASSDIGVESKANSDIGIHSLDSKPSSEIGYKIDSEFRAALAGHEDQIMDSERQAPAPPSARLKPSLDLRTKFSMEETKIPVEDTKKVETARVVKREAGSIAPIPKPRSVGSSKHLSEQQLPVAPSRKLFKPAGIAAKALSLLSIPKIVHTEPTESTNEDVALSDSRDENKNSDFACFVELRDKRNSNNIVIDSRIEKARSIADKENSYEAGTLRHVKSMCDIYSLSLEYAAEETSEDSKSLPPLSCAVISTIPKCSQLTPKTDEKGGIEILFNSEKKIKSTPNETETLSNESNDLELLNQLSKKVKVFRSQSTTNEFDVGSFDKHPRYLTSVSEDFTCALNPNFAETIANTEAQIMFNETTDIEVSETDSRETPENSVEEYPATVIHETHWNDRTDFGDVNDNWAPQVIDQSASGDRTTDTDILLQKVSDTLSNSLPSSSSPPPLPPLVSKSSSETEAVMNSSQKECEKEPSSVSRAKEEDAKNHVVSEKSIDVKSAESKVEKARESILSERNVVDSSTPNVTITSQQDTSDYVSATGDDLSITDWEYQLPAPPSAFRDNISSDFDGYDTITLRSVEAFKEPIASSESCEVSEAPLIESPIRESPIPPPIVEETEKVSKPIVTQKENREETQTLPPKSKITPQTSIESRISETSVELKKEIINELATKIENGSLPQSNGRSTEHEIRRTSDCAAPKIAPVDNTLSNFTITTYSRQKSLNIFEEEDAVDRRNVPQIKNTEDKVVRTFATLSRNKSSAQSNGGNYGSRITLDRIEDNIPSETKSIVNRAQNVERVITPEIEFRKPETKIPFTQHDSLFRRQSMNNGHEKTNVVHRSKSYITLANNSKYREDVDGEKRDYSNRDECDDGRIVKSTSVTNLNQETNKNNEKFSQWRENILKRQEEPSKEKQLQSLQVLKSILPQLKNNQQTEENVPDSSNEKEISLDTSSKILPEVEQSESKSSGITVIETKPQKTVEDATTKRYTYAGPPAISLGSWSERPRVNVQLKMDTDYKYGVNNTSGAKTIVNLNRTNGEKHSNENTIKILPSNGTSSQNERQDRWNSEDLLAKKLINHTTACGFKKPTLNRVGFPEQKNAAENKPIVTSVALKKTQIEKSDFPINNNGRLDENDDDDIKIDTKPVNFKELTKTFGQEVCLRAKPKRPVQSRHSDYYGTRPDIVQSFLNTTNGQTNFLDNTNKNVTRSSIDSTKTQVISNGAQRDAPIRRYTSVVGIQSQNNYHISENGDSTKSYIPNNKTNGPMPVVKGFKIQTVKDAQKISNHAASTIDVSKKTSNVPPPPPTMPIITGVTLKNSNARPKSMPISSVDPRNDLLESIRNFGGRNGLKNVHS